MRFFSYRLLTLFTAILFNTTIIFANNDTTTLIFVGDVMMHSTQFNGVLQSDGSYDFSPSFKYIKEEVLSADMALANLEVPLGGKPYSGYPMFSGPDEIALDLKKLGFNVLVTANNHSCDKGKNGIERTIKMLDSFEIQHTGMFLNKEEREKKYPLIVETNGLKFAILNYTYGTNGIPVQKPLIVNLIDTLQIVEDIEKAKLSSPDLIIACMHWGVEYQQLPNKEQKTLADMLFHNGVNLIIGAHPHVIQPMEKRYSENGRCEQLVAYSLGNLISNQPFENSDGGAILKISLIKDSIGTRIAWAGYSLAWVYKPKENGKTRHYLLPVADYDNNGNLDAAFQKQLNLFTNNARKLLNKHNVGIDEYKIK